MRHDCDGIKLSGEWNLDDIARSPRNNLLRLSRDSGSLDSDVLNFLVEGELGDYSEAGMRRKSAQKDAMVANRWVWNGRDWSRGEFSEKEADDDSESWARCGPTHEAGPEPKVERTEADQCSHEVATSWLWDGSKWSNGGESGPDESSPCMPPVALALHRETRIRAEILSDTMPAMPPMAKMRRTGGSMDEHRGSIGSRIRCYSW